jgi:hypothetical protein
MHGFGAIGTDDFLRYLKVCLRKGIISRIGLSKNIPVRPAAIPLPSQIPSALMLLGISYNDNAQRKLKLSPEDSGFDH